MNPNVEKALVILALAAAATAAVEFNANAAPAARPAPAPATLSQRGPAPDANGLTAWGILPWSGIGIGGRYMLSLPTDSLLPGGRIRDRFALEFGADVIHYSYHYDDYYYPYNSRYDYSWNQVLPVFGVMWNVWLTDRLVVYPKTEIGYGIGWYSGDDYNGRLRNRPRHGGIDLDFAGGIMFALKNGITLRGEVGVSGVKAGVGWLF
jgi:hypothetical protein